MGLLDKASRRFARASEETVRVVDYDAMPKNEEPAQREKEPKAPRKKLDFSGAKNLLPSLGKHHDEEPEDDEEDNDVPAGELHRDITESRHLRSESTAFEIDDSEPNFYEEKQAAWDSKNQGAGVNELVPDNGAIQDVLDVLKIPSTFVIGERYLMPDDFQEIDFDIQVPQGFDQGQVQYFVERAESTVAELIRLLQLRNEHIAKLATTVDRLQVDANNLKYDNQLAAGIGIIPTSDAQELENENLELKLKIQRLTDQQKTTLNSDERKLYEGMRNELSSLTRECEELKESNQSLRFELARYEEEADDMPTGPAYGMEHESAEIVFESADDDEELPDFGQITNSAPEPVLDVLPDFDELPAPTTAPAASREPKPKTQNSSFDLPEDDVADFLDTLKIDDGSTDKGFGEDDDEEDELDKLMKGWQ